MAVGPALNALKIKIFADCADLATIERLAANPLIKGFTTNPSLMRKAGIIDYERFAHEAVRIAGSRPISFEVFADDFGEMEKQAFTISSWGKNVYVKIPVTNTKAAFAGSLIARLSHKGTKVNVTAVFTPDQVKAVVGCLSSTTPAIISVFAGRVADTGRDAEAKMREMLHLFDAYAKAELLWASTRELWNIFEAERAGCHIITVTDDVIAKLPLVGKNLDEFSLETVRQFYNDAKAAGYTI